MLWKQHCPGVSPGEVGFREGLAEQQVELGGVLQAGLPLVEAVSHDTIWKLLCCVFGIMMPTYTHVRTHARTLTHRHTYTQAYTHTKVGRS